VGEHKDQQSGQATKGIGGSDPRDEGEPSKQRPGHSGQPDEMPLTMGSNGGGRDDDQPGATDSGRKPGGTEVHSQHRKAS
jgi:hypothetical protein